MTRAQNRRLDELRNMTIEHPAFGYGEGSCLISMGRTIVLCNASITDGVPRFLKDKNQGWLTAEYAMLPRSTHARNDRESARGKQAARSIEIQRLISRALRQSIDLKLLGERTIQVDCDVLQADGGTRVAAINGGMVALVLALRQLQYEKTLAQDPLRHMISAVSVGFKNDDCYLDLDYEEDHTIDVDLNLIMNDQNHIIEIQGTAEDHPINKTQLHAMVDLAEHGIQSIRQAQEKALS